MGLKPLLPPSLPLFRKPHPTLVTNQLASYARTHSHMSCHLCSCHPAVLNINVAIPSLAAVKLRVYTLKPGYSCSLSFESGRLTTAQQVLSAVREAMGIPQEIEQVFSIWLTSRHLREWLYEIKRMQNFTQQCKQYLEGGVLLHSLARGLLMKGFWESSLQARLDFDLVYYVCKCTVG